MQIDHQKLALAYNDVLTSIINHPEPFSKNEQLVALYPMSGRGETVDTLYFGRALNGWKWHFTLKDIQQNPDEVLQWIVQNGQDKYQPHEERLDWVQCQWQSKDLYNTARSQFWQVIRRVAMQRQGDASNWWDEVAWSNLLKLAPSGKNPSAAQMKVMGTHFLRMAVTEIQLFKPTNVVCLTGMNWANNLLNAGTQCKKIPYNGNQLKYVGDRSYGDHNCRVVVAPHPQGKSSSKIADEILQVLEAKR